MAEHRWEAWGTAQEWKSLGSVSIGAARSV